MTRSARGIDFERLREDISIGEVLAYLGSAPPSGRAGWSDWVSMNCPFCTDRNGSASVNRRLGRFLCHQCGAPRDEKAGDIVDLAMFELNTKDTKEAVEWLTRTFGR